MNTVIPSRCAVFCTKTFERMSRFDKTRTILSSPNRRTFSPFLFSDGGSIRSVAGLNDTTRFIYRKPQRRNTHLMLFPINESIIKCEGKHFSVGRVVLKPDGGRSTNVKKGIESLTDKFMEARELLDDARESEGTVYFTEDMEEAEQAVRDTLDEYSMLLSELSEQERQEVVRTIGLKMEELKAQLQAILQHLKEDH